LTASFARLNYLYSVVHKVFSQKGALFAKMHVDHSDYPELITTLRARDMDVHAAQQASSMFESKSKSLLG